MMGCKKEAKMNKVYSNDDIAVAANALREAGIDI